MTSDPGRGAAGGAQLSDALSTITRRQFLRALIAAGASVALPVAIEQASAEQIDAAWEQALAKPPFFEVNEWRTILEPGVKEPKIWSDLYGARDVRPRDPEHLILEVQGNYPLQAELQQHAEYLHEETEAELETTGAGSARRADLEQLLEELSDPERGWEAWIRKQGTAGIDAVWDIVSRWLEEPVDWDQYEYFPMDWHGTGRAYRFFEGLDPGVLDTLGVVIVEGDHPGSDYFAAELHEEIDEANAKAAELGLPFRFHVEEAQS